MFFIFVQESVRANVTLALHSHMHMTYFLAREMRSEFCLHWRRPCKDTYTFPEADFSWFDNAGHCSYLRNAV